MQQHLGGASYLYLRGMNGQAQQGCYYWKPEDEFILRLDAILGYFSEDKAGKNGVDKVRDFKLNKVYHSG